MCTTRLLIDRRSAGEYNKKQFRHKQRENDPTARHFSVPVRTIVPTSKEIVKNKTFLKQNLS